MAISSIHIEAGGGGYFDHNSRERETANAIFDDEPNFCSCSKNEAFEVYRSELKIRSDAYTDRTGQKLQKNAVTHLSAIVNFNKEHTPEDMQKVCDLLERKFDTKVLQMAMHRDEGKINEDGTPDKNYHAHIEFMGLNSKGESIRRQLTKAVLSNLQTEVAKELGMERGISATYTKDEYKLITAELKKPEEYDSKKEYNKAFRERAQELNIHKPKRTKRLDTYDFKFHQQEKEKAVKEAVLATQKELKAEMAKLREQLQQAGAGRAEYAALEQINRELKEQIKAKDLTIDQLKERTDQGLSLSDQYASLPIKERLEMRSEMRELLGENEELKNAKAEIKALKEAKAEIPHEPINASKIVQLQDEVKMLTLTNTVLERELKETKSAPVPKGENEASRAVEKYIETLPRSTGVQLKADEHELRRFENGAEAKEKNYRYGEEYAEQIVKKHTNFVGKVDKEALIAELGKEFKETAQVLNRGLILVNEFKTAFERTRNSFNSAVKGAETALKDVFHKITGKSTEQINEQRREQERAIQQEKIKQAEAQRAKEPEQTKRSQGLSLER